MTTYLYNNSTKNFGLANGRVLKAKDKLSIQTEEQVVEAEKLVKMQPNDVSFDANEAKAISNLNDENEALKRKIAELEAKAQEEVKQEPKERGARAKQEPKEEVKQEVMNA